MNLTFFSINVHWRRKSHLISRKDSSLSQVYASCQQVKQVQHVNIHIQKLNPAILPVTWLFFIWHRDKRPRTSYISIKDMFISSSCWESIFFYALNQGKISFLEKTLSIKAKVYYLTRKHQITNMCNKEREVYGSNWTNGIKVTRERVISPKFTL